MEKPLSRKEFLQHIGIIFFGVLGISRVLELALKPAQKTAPQLAKSKSSRSWGTGKFGV